MGNSAKGLENKLARYLVDPRQRPFTQFLLSYLAMALAVGAVTSLIVVLVMGDGVNL